MPELPDRAPTQQAAPFSPSEGAVPGYAQPAVSRKPARKTTLAAAAGLVAGIILGVSGALVAVSIAGAKAPTAPAASQTEATAAAVAAPTSVLKDAVSTCRLKNNPDARLGDNDTSLTLNGAGKEDFATLKGLPDSLLSCLLDAAKTPDYVHAQMEQTRALDGTQRGTWGSISASWTYHPDSGLDVVLTETPATK